MIKFVSFTNINPTVEPLLNIKGFAKPNVEKETAVENPKVVIEEQPVILDYTPIKESTVDTNSLLSKDIEDIFRQAGLLTINGKQIKFGSRELRDQNASYGAKNSNHKKRDPQTGYAMARDISIVGGNLNDYAEFRKQIMANDLISKYMDTKGWGIINEVTPEILSKTKGTRMHFHFGPDEWAKRTWNGWKENPDIAITQSFNKGGRFTFKRSQMVKNAEQLNGKKDMRKKLVKSDVITNKKRIKKGQAGLKFVSYTPVETPIYKPILDNPFSEYNFPSTYKDYITKEEETAKPVTLDYTPIEETTAEEPIAESLTVETPKPTRIANHIYKDRNAWVKDLKAAYKKAGITNENAIKMLIAQDALESGWGKSAQGKFNYGNLTPGKSWKGKVVTGNDHDSKGKPITQKFRSYNSIDEYAADKVQFLKSLYDFNENDDISTFTKKLQGGNKDGRMYAGNPEYIKLVTKIYNTSKI